MASKIPFLFEILERRNITSAQLAAAIGVSSGNVADWKSGRSAPKPEAISKIADYLNCSTDYLLGRDDAPAPAAEPMGLTARDERDIERFDPVKAIFDDSDVRSLARDRLKGVSKEEIALKKQQLKAMVAAMWMKEENEK